MNKKLFITGCGLILLSVSLTIGTIRGSQPTEIMPEPTSSAIVETVSIRYVETPTETQTMTERQLETEIAAEIIEEEIIEVTQTEETEISVSDLELLAKVIMAEAGNSCYEMQYLVGVVVINRINFGYWGDTMTDVIYAGGQYACTGKLPYIEPSDLAWSIAEDLLRNGHNVPENVIFQAEFIQGNGIYAQIDNMYFCYR